MNVEVRKARQADAEGIAIVAGALQIGDERPVGAGKTGFLLWAQDPETYIRRIGISDQFVVAEEHGQIVGFLMAYSLGALSKLSAEMSYEDEVLRIFDELYEPSTIYPDQVGVLPSHKRRGIASMMDRKMLELSPNVSFATVIGHGPIRNEASIGYFTSCGYEFVRELEQGEWTLGLYQRLRESQQSA